MNILLTGSAILIPCLLLVACAVLARRAERHANKAYDWYEDTVRHATHLRAERGRVTVLERELEALRRELRKLSGKFYADLKAREDDQLFEEDADATAAKYFEPFGETTVADIHNRFPVCEKWAVAQAEGPRSDAAKCECLYCLARRAERRRLRGELVPRTVQGQAELARLNGDKPR